MEIIPTKSTTHTFSFLGKGSEYAIIFFKNLLLTILSLGLYYPWAKVEKLKYLYQATEFKGNRFTFHGTGKEVFKGFIKVYVLFVSLYLFVIFATATEMAGMAAIAVLVFYGAIILIIPLAIHGSARYRSSRSSWRGIHFKYFGSRKEMYQLCVKGFLLTIITFGIYGHWFQVNLKAYIAKHLKFGNITFNFTGDGLDLFLIHLKGVFLSYITFGIYSFWYMRELYQFNIQHIELYQGEERIKTTFNISAGDVFSLIFVNAILIVFTLGLAAPWVATRTLAFFINNLALEGVFNEDDIQQEAIDDYDDAAGDDYLDFFDLDLL
ncbi:DUF898 domain-containing protein [Lacinutrix sp. C3R15]|uniref:DUF898 family protein n=1 Tax=Flavobacteriaceae TaxID=49546 RepID=UPI001C088D23|nr:MULTISPECIES: DUF898 family protein [Flavobacteriaceae]MBU2938451.1 DUF898 domain-containing protein [Lacinutrix sp. C3R15]MDO6621765.1 DUF898 family protein [Oceanihabitans sp. 1_MG-2023]